MPSGSSSAMSSPSMLSGAGSSRRCGQFMSVRRPPWTGAWPQNLTSGQRLALPARQTSQTPQGLAGSTMTRSPARGPDMMTPPISWPSTSGSSTTDVADAAVLVPVEVGAAEAHGGDAHELLAGGGDGLWFLVDTDVVGAV